MMIYLDANATEPVRPEARAAALAAMGITGNASSVHSGGRRARATLEAARRGVAARLGAAAAELVFTSGGTEADAMAVAGLGAGRQVLVGATEHDAIRAAAPGARSVPVMTSGEVRLDALEAMLRDGPALVCLMLANNETGVLHPIAEAAALCHAHGALLHVDGVQAVGRVSVDFAALGADSLAISGHKAGGIGGAGALIFRRDLPLAPLIAGGGQERGRRGGTPALPAIASMHAALEAASGGAGHLASLRDRIEAESDAVVCGAGARLPNTTCIAWPGLRADAQVIALDLAGIAVSAGAACSSGKVARSHVLDAMGLSELAGCAIRVSLPWNASEADADAFIAAYRGLTRKARAAA